ncbi:MAG TPA: hypothetical protein VFO25_08430 [Candidatus Eremiobacteraceae bacterium]|nr:hypothetical protein [Candidatus Eremiobacteraceae bacterium]
MSASKIIDSVQKVVTLVLAIVASITGYQLDLTNHRLAALNEQSDRDKVFSEDLFKEITRLSGHSVQSKMSFAGLWVLAHDPEAQEGLITVAAVSDDDALKEVANSLTNERYSLGDIQNSQQLTAARSALIDQVSGSPRPAPKPVDAAATGASANLLANLTPPLLTGYVYLGTAPPRSATLNPGATISVRSIPHVGDMVTPVTNVHLRDAYPIQSGLGQVIGVVDNTDALQVDDVRSIGLSSSATAVWAKVTVRSRPQAIPTPTSSP